MVDQNGNYTTEDIKSLKAAIASGLLEAEFDGPDGTRKVRYQSYSNMKKALRDMMTELGECPRRARMKIVSSKGYHGS